MADERYLLGGDLDQSVSTSMAKRRVVGQMMATWCYSSVASAVFFQTHEVQSSILIKEM